MINDDRSCRAAECGILEADMERCNPNQCRQDNGYTEHCAYCTCRNCIHSDCDPPEVEDDGD